MSIPGNDPLVYAFIDRAVRIVWIERDGRIVNEQIVVDPPIGKIAKENGTSPQAGDTP